MGISWQQCDQQKKFTLNVSGDFVFSLQKEFRDAYRDAPKDYHYVVDLKACDYMDSSALGMMLVLWDHLGRSKERLSIINANDKLQEILAIARFDDHLKVE